MAAMAGGGGTGRCVENLDSSTPESVDAAVSIEHARQGNPYQTLRLLWLCPIPCRYVKITAFDHTHRMQGQARLPVLQALLQRQAAGSGGPSHCHRAQTPVTITRNCLSSMRNTRLT